ncbi:amidase family protein [Nocardia aurantia]|uniref:Glutamyl-tRNA(Gln) amidotransferase subunit A n=1 Tax=Nocardia aurantia TaxID=2585199 RepID=A0A7K0DJV4_9NOCA|nr:amidase family protein [Nocardia aurantia]MQY25512.1 Glutamyl-tRNA(Gln) amidotransferase subunit A [Nocardia aurantia]
MSSPPVTPVDEFPTDTSMWRVLPPDGPLVPGDYGPLNHARVAVKDLFAVAGQQIGAGNPAWLAEAPVETSHADAVTALLNAGADITGMALTDELAFSLEGANIHYGAVPNPVAPQHLCGGSSSGPAAAVAAGVADIGLGTDTAGSIRVPASYCGLYGLRTTHDAVSRTGLLGLAPSFDTVGLLTRDLDLLTRAADALLPPQPRHPITTILLAPSLIDLLPESARTLFTAAVHALGVEVRPVEVPLPDLSEATDPGPDRPARDSVPAEIDDAATGIGPEVAVSRSALPADPAPPAVASAPSPDVASASSTHTASAPPPHTVSTSLPHGPGLPSPPSSDRPDRPASTEALTAVLAAFRAVQAAEAWRLHGDFVTKHPGALAPEIAARFEFGRSVTPATEAEAREVLRRTAKAWHAALPSGTAFALPAAASPAPHRNADPATVESTRQATLRLTCHASLAGLPALTLPGPQLDGLPLGLCLLAGPGQDRSLLSFAARS